MICEWHNCEHIIYEFGEYYCPSCFYISLLNGEIGYCISCNLFINFVLCFNEHDNHTYASYYDTKQLVCEKHKLLKFYDIDYSLGIMTL